MKRDPENADRVLNDDLVAIEGAGEGIGGSQREDNYDLLLERIRHEDFRKKNTPGCLDLRKYGAVPHSDFGIGLERMVRWMAGVRASAKCIPFPRTINRLKP